MRTVTLPSGRQTSQFGFGASSLLPGISLPHSRKMVETAIRHGIRHFDVAPAYGDGLAEDVLGEIIGDDKSVTITTKIGIPRPPYSKSKTALRSAVASMLRQVPGLKHKLMGRRRQKMATLSLMPKVGFSEAIIRQSLEESLRRLKRSQVDCYLLHEPHPAAITDELRDVFLRLESEGLIGCFGIGGAKLDKAIQSFGTVRQTNFDPSQNGFDGQFHSWYGLVNHVTGTFHNIDKIGEYVTAIADSRPDQMFLVKAGTARRLEDLLSGL